MKLVCNAFELLSQKKEKK